MRQGQQRQRSCDAHQVTQLMRSRAKRETRPSDHRVHALFFFFKLYLLF